MLTLKPKRRSGDVLYDMLQEYEDELSEWLNDEEYLGDVIEDLLGEEAQ